MASDDRIRPTRLLLLGGLLVVVFLLLLALAVVRLGPVVWGALSVA